MDPNLPRKRASPARPDEEVNEYGDEDDTEERPHSRHTGKGKEPASTRLGGGYDEVHEDTYGIPHYFPKPYRM